jgi:hypothetical protein
MCVISRCHPGPAGACLHDPSSHNPTRHYHRFKKNERIRETHSTFCVCVLKLATGRREDGLCFPCFHSSVDITVYLSRCTRAHSCSGPLSEDGFGSYIRMLVGTSAHMYSIAQLRPRSSLLFARATVRCREFQTRLGPRIVIHQLAHGITSVRSISPPEHDGGRDTGHV